MCRCKQERHGSSSCVELPILRRNETWSEYCERIRVSEYCEHIRVWETKRLERLHAKGRYESPPYAPDQSAWQRSLLLTLAWLSWFSRPKGYAPIKASSRAIPALMGCSQQDASSDLHQLINAGALELDEPTAGRRSGTYRIILRTPKKHSPEIHKSGPSEPTPTAAASQSDLEHIDPERAALVQKVPEQFGDAAARNAVARSRDELSRRWRRRPRKKPTSAVPLGDHTSIRDQVTGGAS